MNNFWVNVGIVAGAVMPLWNIPLIWRIIKRKTSDDISLSWVWGVWACIALMIPSALASKEMGFKVYGISNIFFFSFVVLVVMMYRKNGKKQKTAPEGNLGKELL